MKDLKKGAESDNPDSTDLKTFSIGYTYDVSDSTSLYGMVARTE
jgi:predicted porin